MSRTIKLVSAAIAIALAATITAIVAYDRGRADKGSSVRSELRLDSKSPVVKGSVRGVTVQAQPHRYRGRGAPETIVALVPSANCQRVTWQAFTLWQPITIGKNTSCSRFAVPATAVGYSSAGSSGTRLAIRHVRNGCHIWSDGTVQAASLRLNLTRRPRLQVRLQRWPLGARVTREARLRIINRDAVAHQLVQLAGPNLALRGHMMTGKTQLIRFSHRGVYRFENKVVKMGPQTEVKTMGPDNTLRLTVTVR